MTTPCVSHFDDLEQRAHTLASRQQWTGEAEALNLQLLRQNPRHREALHRLIEHMLAHRRLTDASTYLGQLTTVAPDDRTTKLYATRLQRLTLTYSHGGHGIRGYGLLDRFVDQLFQVNWGNLVARGLIRTAQVALVGMLVMGWVVFDDLAPLMQEVARSRSSEGQAAQALFWHLMEYVALCAVFGFAWAAADV